MKKVIAVVFFLMLAVCVFADAKKIYVSDFGAVANDGKCDMDAINKAIQQAVKDHGGEVVFSAGTYNLRHTCYIKGKGHGNYIRIYNGRDISLVGQVDKEGMAATRLERDFPVNNDSKPFCQIYIEDSNNITFKNFVLVNNPAFGSAGKVVSVDRDKDEVVVDVFEGLTCYDGMRCCSANAWDLKTGKLKRVAALTIGTTIKDYWKVVPGNNGRRLRIRGAGFSDKVEVGDGISWHQKAEDFYNQTGIMHSANVTFENIKFPNVIGMGMLAGYNHNLTFRKVRFEPEGKNLAVGSRDGMHLSMTSGKLIVEDCYYKGLRMDPLVIKRLFGKIVDVISDNEILVKPGYEVPAGDKLRFWVGEGPEDKTVVGCRRDRKSKGYIYKLADGIASGTKVGSIVTYLTYSLDSAVIRNTVFEDNFGSGIVNFEANVLVEGCRFDNNSYGLKYGPNAVSGGFVRNNIFRNNKCVNSCWIDVIRHKQPAIMTIHSASKYFKDPMYNKGIVITGNVFKNVNGNKDETAIDIRNATDVKIYGNEFSGFERNCVIDKKTTRDIICQ